MGVVMTLQVRLVRSVVSLALTSITAVRAQVPAGTPPAFEVASVKANKSGTTQANFRSQPNGITIVNLPLRAIIQLAYRINQPSRLIGYPDWTNSERFDITAHAAGPVSDDERRLMMQALLADRFKLVARLQKREVSVLALMLARNDGKLGPNLKPSLCTPSKDTSGTMPICGPKSGGPDRLILTGASIQQFTTMLGLMLGQTVVDKTGLTGTYDLDISYRLDQATPAGDISPSTDRPSIYTALREQLGLKLESQKDQEEILVIDHIERVSEN